MNILTGSLIIKMIANLIKLACKFTSIFTLLLYVKYEENERKSCNYAYM